MCYLFLVVEVHLTVGHFPPQPVHLLAELQLVLPLVRRFIELLGQVEVLTVQLGVLLTQLRQLLLQVSDHLRQHTGRKTGDPCIRSEEIFIRFGLKAKRGDDVAATVGNYLRFTAN